MTVCGGRTRRGTKCQRPAGWGTDHVGEGRCKLHGGNAGRPIIHGRYSLKHRQSLAEKQRLFLADPEPGNLTSELALTRALLQDYLDRFPDDIPLSMDDITHILGMIESVSKLVERISRILNSTALTQAEVQFLLARFTDLMVTYIDDPGKRERFMGELRKSIGVHPNSSIPSLTGTISSD